MASSSPSPPAVLIGALGLGLFGAALIAALRYALEINVFSGNGLNL